MHNLTLDLGGGRGGAGRRADYENIIIKNKCFTYIKQKSDILAFFTIIHEVNPNIVICCGIECRNNGLKREENQIYYFYLSESDLSQKIED